MLGFLFERIICEAAFHVVSSMDSDLVVGALLGEVCPAPLGSWSSWGWETTGGQQQRQT